MITKGISFILHECYVIRLHPEVDVPHSNMTTDYLQSHPKSPQKRRLSTDQVRGSTCCGRGQCNPPRWSGSLEPPARGLVQRNWLNWLLRQRLVKLDLEFIYSLQNNIKILRCIGITNKYLYFAMYYFHSCSNILGGVQTCNGKRSAMVMKWKGRLRYLLWTMWLSEAKISQKVSNYCWWKKSCTSWYGKNPIICRVLYIPGGAGFLPSTVCQTHEWNPHLKWGCLSRLLPVKGAVTVSP